jgi:hypothetical protein
MKLYVANCTIQPHVFAYRLDFRAEGGLDLNPRLKAARQQPIASGRQIPVGGELHQSQVEELVQQLQAIGSVDVSEVKRIRAFTTYVFSIGKPISENIIRYVYNTNVNLKVAEGAQRRTRAAVAANEALVQKISDDPHQFAVEIEQEEVSEAGEKPIAEGFNVEPMSAAKTPTGRRQSRSSKAQQH